MSEAPLPSTAPPGGPASDARARSITGHLRRWQRHALGEMERWSAGSFLISAAPGAGKTRPALEFARRQLAAGAIDARRRRVSDRAAHAAVGTRSACAWRRPCARRRLAAPAAWVPRRCGDLCADRAGAAALGRRRHISRTLVIADEAHHLGEELAWGEGFSTALRPRHAGCCCPGRRFDPTRRRSPASPTTPTGSPSPTCPTPTLRLFSTGSAGPCCFVAYDGTLSWRSGDDVIESSFETVLSTREASRRYRTAISTELPDGLPRILREADGKLRALRAAGHADAGGLVIAADSAPRAPDRGAAAGGDRSRSGGGPARRAARRREAGRSSRNSRDPVDRRRQHGVRGRRHPAPASRRLRDRGEDAARLPPDRRALRAHASRARATEPSWLYIPADPILRDHAATIEQELRHALRDRGGSGGPDRVRSTAERRETERGGGAAVRAAERRCRAPDDAVRTSPSATSAACAAGARSRRLRRRLAPTGGSRQRPASASRRSPRSRRSSAAPVCARSATGSSPT